ncbi:MAG: NAD(+) diphosphatase [Thermomonas sp.]|uniref:NAD(+) diphosphatase n=1 Tax=Thermomonas sp. TaxID=1971895 RepID=UPI002C01A8DB|nr:NAD(+) diphosphatase [Thermomonas sp.]HQY82439.1 NAD(+) diphosphatase [Thermomonas sp.]HRA02303.1 NAD(+) diphosphatase [Thermomonas sp.]
MNGSGSPFAFVDGALDRADQLREDNAALQALWPRAGVIVLDEDGRAFADDTRALRSARGAELGGGPGASTFLGLRDGEAWFFANASTLALHASQRVDLRQAAAHWPAWQASLFAQARALQHWHQRHRHCSACGASLEFRRAGWLGVCTGCNSEHYPRTDQAVIVAVGNGGRLLLGRQASWPKRRWSLVAGFVEPGETLEQTVAREVLEETGVRVRAGSARYLASQPWPFPGSLMLGFIAEAEADEPVAGDELEQARWFSAAEVRAGIDADWTRAHEDGEGIVLAPPISIARHVIRAWLAAHDATGASK